jgi:hypothetical protein
VLAVPAIIAKLAIVDVAALPVTLSLVNNAESEYNFLVKKIVSVTFNF